MPNICENYVIIRGSRDSLDMIKAAKLDMMVLVPPPENLKNTDGWSGQLWDWVQENHSTKWISNEEHDDLPVIDERRADSSALSNGTCAIDDQHVYLISHFDSAWVFPYAFYQNLIRRFPDVSIEYQYHSWEGAMIGHGKMNAATVDTEPTHCSYETPDELNAAIREFEGTWMVGTGNPHFDYDSQTGLYKWQTAGGGGCEWVSETEAGGAAAAGADADSC